MAFSRGNRDAAGQAARNGDQMASPLQRACSTLPVYGRSRASASQLTDARGDAMLAGKVEVPIDTVAFIGIPLMANCVAATRYRCISRASWTHSRKPGQMALDSTARSR